MHPPTGSYVVKNVGPRDYSDDDSSTVQESLTSLLSSIETQLINILANANSIDSRLIDRGMADTEEVKVQHNPEQFPVVTRLQDIKRVLNKLDYVVAKIHQTF